MKSEMRNALNECMRQLVEKGDATDKALGLAVLTIIDGVIETLDRQASALEWIAVELQKFEPVV